MGFKGRVIGLTGNAACGKSTVARMLVELGVPVVDADQVSREVTAPGQPVLTELAKAFGEGILDESGGLDRKALRDRVFRDEAARKKLESILHPAIALRSRQLFDEYFRAGHPVVVYEATLIVEAGRAGEFNGLIMVSCNEGEQLRRILARDPGMSAELAARVLNAQLSQHEKAKHATWVIENNGTLEELREKVSRWCAAHVGKKAPSG